MLGKKLSALMVMVLFVVSMIPLAFAQEDTNLDAGGSVRAGHGKDITETSHRKDIRDRAVQAQTSFGDVKAKIVNNRVEVAKCLADSGMSGCAALLQQDLTDRKDYLLHAIERITAVLDNLEDMAQHISDATERDELVQHMKDKRDELHEITLEIGNVQDREQLKAARDLLKDSYEDMKNLIEQYKASTRLAMLQNLNAKLLSLNERLRSIADKLEIVGVNLGTDYPEKSANLLEAVNDVELKLDMAKEKYQHVLDLKASGAGKTELKSAIAEARDYLGQARSRIKDARNHVQDLVMAFKNRAGAGQLNQAIAETATIA